jgi:hypothetical protein
MTIAVRSRGLTATVVFISMLGVASQARAQSTSPTAAYVYIQIQGPEGSVYGFRATSSGQLGVISGSPFKLDTAIIGSIADARICGLKDTFSSLDSARRLGKINLAARETYPIIGPLSQT